jgi:hypothetical protein
MEVFSLKDIGSLPDLEEFRAIDEQRALFDPPAENAAIADEAAAATDIDGLHEGLDERAGNGVLPADEVEAMPDTAQSVAAADGSGDVADEASSRGDDKP